MFFCQTRGVPRCHRSAICGLDRLRLTQWLWRVACDPVNRPPEIAPYRKTWSCSSTDVHRYHVNTAMSQLIANLPSGISIESSVYPAALAAVDRAAIMGNLLIAFARIGLPQFVKAFKVVLMEVVSGGANDSPLHIEVAFARCQQVAATVGGDMFGKPQCVASMLIHRDPTRRACPATATFGAVLDIDLAELFCLSL